MRGETEMNLDSHWSVGPRAFHIADKALEARAALIAIPLWRVPME